MQFTLPSALRALTIAASLAAALPYANADTYTFTQSGYDGGGMVTGSFEAVDLDGDGQISSFAGEVSNYSLSFSGDAMVGNFTHGYADLSGLVYDVGSGFIGDGSGGAVEGMASNWGGVSGVDYASGLGPTGLVGGRVIDVASGATSSTDQLIVVTAVPEPAGWALMFGGLGLLAAVSVSARARRT